MTSASTLLVALVVLGAAWLLVHLLLLWRALRAQQLGRGLRALALVPPATPVLAFMAGARLAVLAWVALGATYGLLRLQAAELEHSLALGDDTEAKAEHAPAPEPPIPAVHNPSGDCPAPNNGVRLGYTSGGARWLPDCQTPLREQYFRVFATSEQRAWMTPRPDALEVTAQACADTQDGALHALLERYTLCAAEPDIARVNAMSPVDALAIAHALHERLRFTAQGSLVRPPPQTSDVLAICDARPDLASGVLRERCAWDRRWRDEMAAGKESILMQRLPPDAEGPPLAAALNQLYGIAER
jgi:hypothetical protein